MIELLVYLVPPIVLILVGLLAGRAIASWHRSNLDQRQAVLSHIQVSDVRRMDDAVPGTHPPRIVISEVTLGADYFISLLARLRNLIGGNIGVFEELLLRARREALTRLQEQARADGYNALANVRLQFVDISGNATYKRKQKAIMVTILAHATAYHTPGNESPPHAPAAA